MASNTPTKKPTAEERLAEAAELRNKQVEHLAGMFTGLTLAISVKTNIPEVLVAPDESAEIVNAFLTMSEEFGWEPDPRVTASINFVAVLGAVVGSHFIQYKSRVAGELEETPDA